MIKSKKGFIPLLAPIGIGMAIVIAIIIAMIFIGFGLLINYFITHIFLFIGAFIVVAGGIAGLLIPQENKNKLVVLIVAIILGLIIMGLHFTGLTANITIGGSNFYVKSMSTITAISKNTNLAGVWWLVDTYYGGGQYLVGTLTPEQSKLLSGYTIQYPLTLTSSGASEKIEYNILNSGESINLFSYTLKTSSNYYLENGIRKCKTNFIFTPDNAPNCPLGTLYNIPYQAPSSYIGGYYVCYRICISPQQIGMIGNINYARTSDIIPLTLTVNSESISQILSQDNPNANFISSTKGLVATAQFPASGVTGNAPPSTSQYFAYYDLLSSNRWSISSQTNLNNYKTTFTSASSNLYRESTTGQNAVTIDTPEQYYNNIRTIINSPNNAVSKIRSDDMSIAQNQIWGNRNDRQNGKIIIDASQQILVPDLIFKIRADWLGIVFQSSQPKIIAKTCNDFKSGDNGKISIQIQNIGNDVGTFKASIVCSIIKPTYTSTTQTVNQGEVGVIDITIDSGTFAGDKIDTCQIHVQDINDASLSDDSSVSCHILPPAQCVEGDSEIRGNCIYKCINGVGVEQKCCGTNEEATYNETTREYYCKSGGGDGDGGCKWYEEEYTSVQKDYGFMYWRALFGNPIETPIKGCKTAGWIYGLIFGLIILILVIILIIVLLVIRKPNYQERDFRRRR